MLLLLAQRVKVMGGEDGHWFGILMQFELQPSPLERRERRLHNNLTASEHLNLRVQLGKRQLPLPSPLTSSTTQQIHARFTNNNDDNDNNQNTNMNAKHEFI